MAAGRALAQIGILAARVGFAAAAAFGVVQLAAGDASAELTALRPPRAPAIASAPRFEATQDGGVRFRLTVSEALEHQVFRLSDPDRLVIDFPSLAWRFDGPAPDYSAAVGVKRLRISQFSPERSRLVLDLEGAPSRIRPAALAHPGGDAEFTLEFRVASAATAGEGAARAARAVAEATADLLVERPARLTVPVAGLAAGQDVGQESEQNQVRDPAPEVTRAFGAADRASGPAPMRAPRPALRSRRLAMADLGPLETGSATAAPSRAPRPGLRPAPLVVVIDPGHGGHDAGTAHGGVAEKKIVLEVARRVRERLGRLGGVRVVMTRDDDEFIKLPERVQIARRADAALFLSLHVDALADDEATSGASVYTMSDNGVDRLTQRLSRREFADSAIAGVSMAEASPEVRRTLVAYQSGKVMGASRNVADLLLAEFRGRVPVLRGRPHRHDELAVLKTIDMPAVLIELGFVTNPREREAMTGAAWQDAAAEAVAAAVRRWRAGETMDVQEASLQQ